MQRGNVGNGDANCPSHSDPAKMHKAAPPSLTNPHLYCLFLRRLRFLERKKYGMSLTREAGARQMFSVDLVGPGHATTLFLADPKRPALSATQLMKSTKWTQPRVTNSAAGNQDATTKSEIWTGACAEAETEWLTGPLAHDTLLSWLGLAVW